MASPRTELTTLRNLISQADLILVDSELPGAARCHELLSAAVALTDDLLSQTKPAKASPAALLGRKGGSVTAQKGSDHFRKLAAMRKSHAGGRPRKETD
jgi:hypothetical protein